MENMSTVNAMSLATIVVAIGVYGMLRIFGGKKKRVVKDTGEGIEEERITKQGFAVKKIPENLDAIIIGSGMGGLTTAAVLAKQGKTCLVLEQHDTAGGNCHTFVENGFEFDTGLHYIGGKVGEKSSPTRKQFDYITDNGVEWSPMDDHYDVAGVGKDKFGIHKNIKQLIADLIEKFPEEEKGIREYFYQVRKVQSRMPLLFIAKLLPPMVRSIFLPFIQPFLGMFFEQTSADVISKCTQNKNLQSILAYQYGDFGELPSKSAFGMQAALFDHFNGGAYFPVGGPDVIPKKIVRVIERNGGKVLVRAPVDEILINDAGVATGVVCKGKNILAPIVISSVGAPITFTKLVPGAHSHRVESQIKAISKHGIASDISLMSLFVGLNNDGKELNLPKSNIWKFPAWDHEKNLTEYKKDPLENPLPAAFLSFSSSKDPTYPTRRPGKDVALIIGPCFYDHVAKFKEERVKHRGEDYEKLKNHFKDQLMQAFLEEFPHLEDKIEYVDVGTAVTNDFYLGTNRGAVYGLAHTPERFKKGMEFLDVRTPISGLYLTGQDTLTCGICGALASGFLTAGVISPSFIFGDFLKLQ